MSEALPELVWNKGIAALCDWRVPDEFPDGGAHVANRLFAGDNLTAKTPETLILDPTLYRGICDGDVVWVRLSWLKSFIGQVLPLTKARFVLATGDSPNSVPLHIAPYADVLVRAPQVTCWFAQNCDASPGEERIRHLPIGIDFHTLSERSHWGEQISSPAAQECELNAIASTLPPVEERIPDIYLDFAWQRGRYGGRARIIRQLSSNHRVFLQNSPLPRTEMWRRRGRFAFVVSPHGIGLDCHRTWEALALGHIVLVPGSPLDGLFAGLAVVSIDDWSQLTPQNLVKWLDSHGRLARFNDRLTSRWWVRKMRDAGYASHKARC
jgi:hypothetical protein